jgi:hypothetical protein
MPQTTTNHLHLAAGWQAGGPGTGFLMARSAADISRRPFAELNDHYRVRAGWTGRDGAKHAQASQSKAQNAASPGPSACLPPR